jgi:hypothetical protein
MKHIQIMGRAGFLPPGDHLNCKSLKTRTFPLLITGIRRLSLSVLTTLKSAALSESLTSMQVNPGSKINSLRDG